jgi:hypothetical protein
VPRYQKFLVCLVWIVLAFTSISFGQAWTGVVAPTRAIDWSNAGAGTIPARTTICTTLNPGASAAQINAAIANCPSGQVVFLNAGTYNLSTGLLLENSNVTLRGAGADKTFLVPAAPQSCGGFSGLLCIWNGDENYSGGAENSANWTAGFGKGTTSITLDGHNNLKVGAQLMLDQYNDTYQISAASCSGGIVTATIGANSLSLSNGKPIATVQGASVSGYNSPALGGSYPITAVTGSTVSYRLPGSCPGGFSGTASITLDDGALTITNDGTFSSFHAQGNNTGRPGNNCGPGGYHCRSSTQIVTVTSCGTNTQGAACTSNSVTVSPGVYDPHIRSDRSPGAWWGTSLPVTGVGVENLSVDGSAANSNIITFYNAINSWGKGTRTLFAGSSHYLLFQASHITVRDSYMYGSQCHGTTCSQSYGSDTYSGASDNLFENNIYQHLAISMQNEGGMGNVYGYNFDTDDDNHVDPTWPLGSLYSHAPGVEFMLSEGNRGQRYFMEDFHGNGAFPTTFRSYWRGWEPGRVTQTVPITIQTGYRNANVIGNVLGTANYSNHYNWIEGTNDGTDTSDCSISIIDTGFDGNCNDRTLTNNCDNNTCEISDTRVNLPNAANPGTTMYWGNYDTVNATTRFNSAEVPSGLPIYANPVPGNDNLPSTFYGVKYSLFSNTAWGTPVFPPIGPDVSGGNIPNVGGFANAIPAQLAFQNLPIDSAYSVSSKVTAASCSNNTATVTIGSQAANVDAGTVIVVTGVSPAGYNCTDRTACQVSSTTSSTVSYPVASCPGGFVSGGQATAPSVLAFNAASSYSGGGSTQNPPPPPENLSVIVQ